jgi:hypothetical protein
MEKHMSDMPGANESNQPSSDGIKLNPDHPIQFPEATTPDPIPAER